MGTCPFTSVVRRTVTRTALNRLWLAFEVIVPPVDFGFGSRPTTTSEPGRVGPDLQMLFWWAY